MTRDRRLLVATTNRGKLREIQALLEGAGVTLVGLEAFPAVAAPEETGSTFEENARLKATCYSRATGLLAVADDSGLEIDAMNRQPGVASARFLGPDAAYPERFAAIYAHLDAVGAPDSPARFVCAVALADGDRVLFETRQTVEGRITRPPRGEHGFGYDPIFLYPPAGRTTAELLPHEKDAISHRGKAFGAVRTFLIGSVGSS